MTFVAAQRIKVAGRRFGIDIGHAPNWRHIFKQVQTIVDVGAHYGETYDYFRGIGWRGPIISFEPAPATFERLTKRKDASWDRRMIALSNYNGTAPFQLYEQKDYSHSLKIAIKYPSSSTCKVSVSRLDAQPLPTGELFLKIDAEASDLDVFEGAIGLHERIPWAMMEVAMHPRYVGEPVALEVFNAMHEWGYRFAFVDRQQPFVDEPQSMDVVFQRVTV